MDLGKVERPLLMFATLLITVISCRYINVTWDMPELTSPETRQKIVDGDLLKVQLTLP